MNTQRITKRLVDTIPAERDLIVWDADVPGFGLRVRASGHKTYVVQYRVLGLGRRGFAKRVSLGEHGKLTPEEARKLACLELGNVARGEDPASARSRRKGVPTVRELGKTYLSDIQDRVKALTAAEYERLWTTHILPSIGNRQVADVSTADIRRLHRSMKDVPYAANRALALLSAFFNFAVSEGAAREGFNPTRSVERFSEEARERFLTADEFRAMGNSLHVAETKGLPPAPLKRYRRKTKNQRRTGQRAQTFLSLLTRLR